MSTWTAKSASVCGIATNVLRFSGGAPATPGWVLWFDWASSHTVDINASCALPSM